jgi:excisionase family DNA binding protein
MEATDIKSPYLDYAGAEEYTTLHRVTLWRAVRDGKLKASGYGRAVRFHVKDLEEFMAAKNRK